MADRLPPQRYRIVERGGRLEVIDLTTGARPPSAAERMQAHDAAHGHQALRYDRLADSEKGSPDTVSAGDAVSGPTASGPTASGPTATPAGPIRTALSQRASPWHNRGGEKRPQLAAQSLSEAVARPGPMSSSRDARPAPQKDKARRTIVTGKWWDAKGPRTITLGEAGRAKLTGGFMTTLVAVFLIAILLMIVEPILLLVAGFMLFQFGGTVMAPIGARIVDQAVSADRGR